MAALAITIASPAAAGSDLQKLQRWLYPHRGAKPAPVLPPAPPIEAAPPVTTVPPAPPPVVLAEPPAPPVAAPAERKPPPKPRRKVKPADDGPDLPWPCFVVRMHAAGKTRAQLEAQGRANGITLTPKQRKQAAACLAGT